MSNRQTITTRELYYGPDFVLDDDLANEPTTQDILSLMGRNERNLTDHSKSYDANCIDFGFSLPKETLKFFQKSSNLYQISFELNAAKACQLSIYWFAYETYNNGNWVYTSKWKNIDNEFVIKENTFEIWESPDSISLDLNVLDLENNIELREEFMIKNDNNLKKDHFPLVIILQNENEKLISYFDFIMTDQTQLEPKPIGQRCFINGKCYILQDIYGYFDPGPKENSNGEERISAPECVICMSEQKDTVVLPCRHMCLCGSCSEVFRQQNDKCPICRQKFTSLLHIEKIF